MCGKTGVVIEEHHIRGRKIPNPNHPSNLANICPNDHADIHEGNSIIERWVATSSGKILSWHKRGEEGITGEDSKTYLIGGQ